MKVLVLVGSLRADSLNSKLAKNFGEIIGRDKEISVEYQYADFPAFNSDEYENAPKSVAEFREKLESADGVLIVSPEYNRSLPGNVKNTLDWSGWMVKNYWGDKKVAISGASMGTGGTMSMQYDLRKVLGFIGAKIMTNPEFFGIKAQEYFTENGELKDEEKPFAEEFAKNVVDYFKK